MQEDSQRSGGGFFAREAQEDSQSHADRFYAAAVCEMGRCLKRLAGFSGLLRGIGVREIIDVDE